MAFAIDFLIWLIALFAIMAVSFLILGTLLPTAAVDQALVAAMYTLNLVLAFVILPATIETLTKGRSVGKVAMGLRVVRDDGGAIRLRHALVRAVCGFAVEFPGLLLPGLTWFAALAVMLIHPSGKRFGDLSAGTIVIHERTPDARIWAPVMPAGLAGWAAVTDLTGVDDDLALAIRHFLARNHEISEPARTKLGTALAAELSAMVVPAPPPGTPGWAFLAAVLAERYRRASGRLAANRAVTAQVWDTLYGAHQGQPSWAFQPIVAGWGPPPSTTIPQVPGPGVTVHR